MSNYIDSLNWRYATKKFDTAKKVPEADLETLLEATRLSPSSYGLQPYHVFVITDKVLREKLKPVSWGQSQITDASHLIVFANETNFDGELVDAYMENVSDTRGISSENLKGYSDFMKSKLLELPTEDKSNWTARQAYIALGNLISAAASMHIDACPMEGFDSEKYDKLLGLTEKRLNAAAVVAIGYRAKEDATQHYKKVRRSKESLFTHI